MNRLAALTPFLLLTVLLLSPLMLHTDNSAGQNQPPFLVAAEEKTTRQDSDEQSVSCFSPALSDSPIPSLAAVAAVAPPAPSNSSCSAPALPSPPSCTDPAFTGQLLKQRRKIVHMILFAFEIDTLEIQLREAADLVDHYFLVEATLTHKGEAKPIMWERIRYTDRFSFLKPGQVIHVVVDQLGDEVAHKAKAVNGVDWWYELEQTATGLNRVRSWAGALSSRLSDSDVFLHGNADEVLGRPAIHSLAHCELSGTMASGALWMPMGNPAFAFRTDHVVKNRPHSISMPAIYTWQVVRTGKQGAHHFQGSKDKYVLGGVHMTNPSFLPNALLKEITGTEYLRMIPGFYNNNHNLTELDRQQARIFALENKSSWLKRIDPASSVSDVVTSLPWWLACNPARYPYWFGKPDPRNAQLLLAMQSGGKEGGEFKVADVMGR